jgi:Ni/Fe-hydrogenase 1 B-type cytochrome subunit
MSSLQAHRSWDLAVRAFHWINLLCVLLLSAIGTIILYADELELPRASEINFKTVHVFVGYVLVLNLLVRLLAAFVGGRHARWAALLPFYRGWWAQTSEYLKAWRARRAPPYVGHSPPGRLAVTVLLLLLFNSAVTGLVIAGTDIFYPPFGRYFAEWVAAPGVSPDEVTPRVPETIDQAARAEMREFRRPFIQLHKNGFYFLLGMIVLHIAAVVMTERRGGGALTSAMLTGTKIVPGEPVDADRQGS